MPSVEHVRVRQWLNVPDGDYVLERVTEDGKWVFRNDDSDVFYDELHSPTQLIEYLCPDCGGWQSQSWSDVGCLGRESDA